jgi:hypothetical protein
VLPYSSSTYAIFSWSESAFEFVLQRCPRRSVITELTADYRDNVSFEEK